EESALNKAKVKDLAVPWVRRIVFLGIGIAVVQQMTGINSIMYYGTEILREAGFGTEAALIGNIANDAISILAVMTGIKLLTTFGRRPLLLIGLTGTTTTLFLIGVFSLALDASAALPYIILSLTVIFLAFFQGAIGPVTWLILSEIFPLRLRGIGMGVSVFCLWMVNFLVGLTFPVMMSSIGLSNSFFFFAVVGVGAIAFVKKYLPETKGLSLEQLEKIFRRHGDQEEAPKGYGRQVV